MPSKRESFGDQRLSFFPSSAFRGDFFPHTFGCRQAVTTLFPNRLHALFIFRQCGSDTLQGFSVVAGLGGGAFILRGEYCFFYAFIVYTAAMHTLPNAPPHALLLRSRSESCHRFGGKGSKRMGFFFGVGRSKTISLEGRFFFLLGAPPLRQHVENIVDTDPFCCRIDGPQCLTIVLTLSMLARWPSP